MRQLLPLAVLLLLNCVACAAQEPPAVAAATESEADLLLTFKAGITNWEEAAAARQIVGWTSCVTDVNCVPKCQWSGVECNPYHEHLGNYVTALRLPCRTGCTVPLQGRLTPGIHRLQHLHVLLLDNNLLNGSLPEAWGEPQSFPELLELNLNNNKLQNPSVGTSFMPPSWSKGPAFLRLADLQLAGNQFSGTFPADFALTNTSFVSIMSINLANNLLTGPLPDFINGLITMHTVRFDNNMFSGTIPPNWGTQGFYFNSSYNETQALEHLSLHMNRLTGTLPNEWAAPGAFVALRQLTLSDNPGLVGTLPAAWGATEGSLPALQDLNVSNTGLAGPLPPWGPYPRSLQILTMSGNNFTGIIPSSWSQLAQLQQVTVQPGNLQLCPIAPEDASFQVCDADDVLCLGTVTVEATACEATPADSDSGFPVAAVVAPVAVVGMLAVSLAGLLWHRRRRRRAAAQRSDSDMEDLRQDVEMWPRCTNGKLPPSLPDSPGSSAAPHLPKWQNGAQHHGSVVDCLSCLKKTWSADLEAQPSASTAGESAGAQSAPLWLPHQLLQQYPSNHSSQQQIPSGNSSGKVQLSERLSLDGGGPGFEGPPCWSAKELSAMQLSDWEIRPDEIEILKHPDGSDWQLGSGGFGTVYKAMRNGVQPVAVKVLGSAHTEVLKAMTDADFAQEISILRACRDTNILQFQGACFQDQRTLLIMEYMEGGNLCHNLRNGKINWYRKGKKIAMDVARALVYLHSRRIVHLDIKSANVLLTRDGTAKVGDVGMAKIMAGDYVSGVVGTLSWSAPELLMGQRCGAKADVYSFGVVLWEICTGEMPVRGQLRDPRVPDECPAEVVSLMYRCLSPDPATRPTSTELVERLMEANSLPPPALQKLPSLALPSAGPTWGTANGGAIAPETRSSASGAGSQHGSHGSSLEEQQQLPVGVQPAVSMAQQQHEQQQEDSRGQSDAPEALQSKRDQGRPGIATAVGPAGGRPPLPACNGSVRSALEERLVTELTDELSTEGPQSAVAPPSNASPVRLQSQGRHSSLSRHDGVGSLQRRLVLNHGKSPSSPFARSPLVGAAPVQAGDS